ncbi:MAG: hypothetical protein ACOX4O_05050 [Eubacteriales bacterium]
MTAYEPMSKTNRRLIKGGALNDAQKRYIANRLATTSHQLFSLLT